MEGFSSSGTGTCDAGTTCAMPMASESPGSTLSSDHSAVSASSSRGGRNASSDHSETVSASSSRGARGAHVSPVAPAMAQQTQDRLSLSPIDSKRATATAASTKRAQEFGKMMLLAGMEADREVNEKQLAVQSEHAALRAERAALDAETAKLAQLRSHAERARRSHAKGKEEATELRQQVATLQAEKAAAETQARGMVLQLEARCRQLEEAALRAPLETAAAGEYECAATTAPLLRVEVVGVVVAPGGGAWRWTRWWSLAVRRRATEYVLELRDAAHGEVVASCRRRYSAIRGLHEAVGAHLALHSFPPKRLLNTTGVVEQRKVELARYLNEAVAAAAAEPPPGFLAVVLGFLNVAEAPSARGV